ncbi:TrbI/VirB10 family protein [Sphingopyxis terrae]|uniref:TrbI/VirB10 family protein n=1 Tax=Sphingopyxis terrae TaxID=33052 RepID=UPI002A14E3D6|nr:TrbI/VirB10 family protein [Sphingopyxis terrae]MDX8356442.1 TrbI/VirB10 family protein [Sphingopyxis terrae]
MSAAEREGEIGTEPAPAPPPPAGAEAFRLGAEPPRVMRLSRKALAIMGGAAGFAIGGALLYALLPAKPKPGENVYDGERANRSEIVTGAPGDYGKIPKLGEPLPGDLGRPILAARDRREAVPVPSIGTQPRDARVAAGEQARVRAAQERDSARSSQLFLGGEASAPSSLQTLGDAALPLAPANSQTPATAADRRHNFLAGGGARPTESAARITAPSSAYVIQAGSVIPAALITGIRSDHPGQITAQVTQNVYDSPTGRFLLIPQGARLVGDYDSEIADGQSRVLLAWDRLILPGGRSIALDRLPGADASGMAGLADRTDYHWGHMVKAAFVSTLLGVGAELGANAEDRLVRAVRGGAQDSVNETGRQLVERQLGIPPTITVRPGTVLRVIVTRDLILEPLEGRAR